MQSTSRCKSTGGCEAAILREQLPVLPACVRRSLPGQRWMSPQQLYIGGVVDLPCLSPCQGGEDPVPLGVRRRFQGDPADRGVEVDTRVDRQEGDPAATTKEHAPRGEGPATLPHAVLACVDVEVLEGGCSTETALVRSCSTVSPSCASSRTASTHSPAPPTWWQRSWAGQQSRFSRR